MLESLLGTRCFSVKSMDTSVFVDLIKGPKSPRDLEKITWSVNLMKNKLTAWTAFETSCRAAS